MKVTLDTNVLVSAFISKQGNPARILDIIATFDEIDLILSQDILEEFKEVLNRDEVAGRFGYSKTDISEFVEAIRETARIVRTRSSFKVVKDDPKDDMIINAAHDGKADFIVSGDGHLQRIKKFRSIRIVNPRQFMRILAKRFGEPMLKAVETMDRIKTRTKVQHS